MMSLQLFIEHVTTIILHGDLYLSEIVRQYGVWVYLILFAVIFCETGLVVTPFLPGDTLLFAAGSLAAGSPPALSLKPLLPLLICAAISGDSTNFWIGRFAQRYLERLREGRYFKHRYLTETQAYYRKYGAMTIILARFVPIIRTFAPFAAGIAHMRYPRFLTFSVIGSVCWVVLLSFSGYFFGSIPIVRSHFSVVVLAIVFLSVLPVAVKAARRRFGRTTISKP